MTVLVTGADGFVGRYVVRRLVGEGYAVLAARRPGGPSLDGWFTDEEARRIRWIPLELTDDASVAAAMEPPISAVIHLAAVASGREARRDPGLAWTINAAGTARLAEAAAARRGPGDDPTLLLVSSGEVYGRGYNTPRVETDPVGPVSPYAASKLGAEIAVQEVSRRTSLRVIVARPFAHTGPGQTELYAIPAFAARLREAAAAGTETVPTGDLSPVRDLLDVRDVAGAYVALLRAGVPGETYNIARGTGVSLADVFERLAGLVGVSATPRLDPTLARAADIPYLVGDSSKLHRATGWSPTTPLHQTLRDVVDAQTH